jgi:hypothetical protein
VPVRIQVKSLKLRILIGTLLLLISTSQAFALEDEQWPIPNTYQDGHHSILIEDGQEFNNQFSILFGYGNSNSYLCSGLNDANCLNASQFNFNSILPICNDEKSIDCIVGFEAISKEGNTDSGIFSKYTQPNHPNKFTGDNSVNIPNPESPSIWNFSNSPHSNGNLYGLTVGINGEFIKGSTSASWSSFYVNLQAVSLKTGNGKFTDVNGFENFPKCIQTTQVTRTSYGCGSGAEEYGQHRCAIKSTENGNCYLNHKLPKDMIFKVNLRLSKEPNGWLHGRVFNPEISIKNSNKVVEVSISGIASEVPTFYSGGQFNDLSKDLQDFWTKCLPKYLCPSGTRKFANDPNNNPNGATRNVKYTPQPYGDHVINQLTELLPLTSDKSVAVPSRWSIRTLESNEMQGANGCFKKGNGLKGIVSTNATVYSEGPPEYSGDNLQYKVAAPHLRPDNQEFRGSYNLVMRSDVARCVYGFSAAPIRATIQVVNEAGVNSIATTTISEKNNWLSLAAYNFTFSSPTIKVNLSQAKNQKYSITCLKGKLIKKVTGTKPKCPVGYKLKSS